MGFFSWFHKRGVEKRRKESMQKMAGAIYARTKLVRAEPDPREHPLEAVRQNGLALGYIEEQTPELCLEAVRQTPCAFFWVKDKTPELCREAVSKAAWLIAFVPDPDPELCLEAVKKDWRALLYIKNQTYEMCREAYRQQPCADYDMLDYELFLSFHANGRESV